VGKADEDKRYVIADVWINMFPGDKVDVGRNQWSLVTIDDNEFSPDGATGNIEGGCPKQETLHADSQNCKVVWEVKEWEFISFKIVPYGNQSGDTVYFEWD
jgi:hypothetical protein